MTTPLFSGIPLPFDWVYCTAGLVSFVLWSLYSVLAEDYRVKHLCIIFLVSALPVIQVISAVIAVVILAVGAAIMIQDLLENTSINKLWNKTLLRSLPALVNKWSDLWSRSK